MRICRNHSVIKRFSCLQFLGEPLQVTVRPMLRDICLSVCKLAYCGQSVGWIKIALGTEVRLGPGDTVLDGHPAPLTERGTAAPRPLSAHVYCGQTVAHLSYCWALVAVVYQESRCETLVSCLDEVFATLKDNLTPERFRFFPDALCEKQLEAFKNTVNPYQVCYTLLVFSSLFCYFIVCLFFALFVIHTRRRDKEHQCTETQCTRWQPPLISRFF